MNKWTKAAKLRLAEIQVDHDGAADMRAMAAAFAKLPPGQLKKVLSEDVVAVLEKYGAAVEQG